MNVRERPILGQPFKPACNTHTHTQKGHNFNFINATQIRKEQFI